MHIQPIPEHNGTFSEENKTNKLCPKCGGSVTMRIWESSCGGYEDLKYTCEKCYYHWWVEGIDS